MLQHEIRDVLTALYSLLCTHYFVLSALYSLLYILYSVFCIFMLTLTVLSHLCSLPACDVFRSDELFYNHYIEKIKEKYDQDEHFCCMNKSIICRVYFSTFRECHISLLFSTVEVVFKDLQY